MDISDVLCMHRQSGKLGVGLHDGIIKIKVDGGEWKRIALMNVVGMRELGDVLEIKWSPSGKYLVALVDVQRVNFPSIYGDIVRAGREIVIVDMSTLKVVDRLNEHREQDNLSNIGFKHNFRYFITSDNGSIRWTCKCDIDL